MYYGKRIRKALEDRPPTVRLADAEYHHKKYCPAKKKVIFTYHASFRRAERFAQYSDEQIANDIRKGWTRISMLPDGRRLVKGGIGRYIMTKDFIIITMY